jgi:pimeloyl-ACP methyl ester carboxylesterase
LTTVSPSPLKKSQFASAKYNPIFAPKNHNMRHLYLAFLLLLCQCSKPESLENTTNTERETAAPSGPDPNALGCEVYRPVVMVHGFLASGDTWAKFGALFSSNGYCNRQINAFDWNSLAQGTNNSALLRTFIDTVLARTGADQVDLIGHSAGGGLCYNFLNDMGNAAKVAHYVHVGSGVQSGPAGPGGAISTLNLWSTGDEIVAGGDITGATNLMLPNKDHYQIATSTESFSAVFDFFNDEAPAITIPTPEAQICVGGRALTFGENQPSANASIQLYYLDPLTGERFGPAGNTTADALGYWLVLPVDGQRPLEIVVTPTTGRVVHYFREPFVRTSTLVYLRTLPGPFSPAGLLLAGLPNTAAQSVFNCFSASQAVVNGRDTLTLDGVTLSTNQFASPEKTAISFFLYDANNNNQSDLTPAGLFGSFSFLSGIDVFANPADAAPAVFQLNSRIQRVPKIPSNEGIEVVVFD